MINPDTEKIELIIATQEISVRIITRWEMMYQSPVSPYCDFGAETGLFFLLTSIRYLGVQVRKEIPLTIIPPHLH